MPLASSVSAYSSFCLIISPCCTPALSSHRGYKIRFWYQFSVDRHIIRKEIVSVTGIVVVKRGISSKTGLVQRDRMLSKIGCRKRPNRTYTQYCPARWRIRLLSVQLEGFWMMTKQACSPHFRVPVICSFISCLHAMTPILTTGQTVRRPREQSLRPGHLWNRGMVAFRYTLWARSVGFPISDLGVW
jgi:hypothetical protein